MIKIGFITSRELANLTDDDRVAANLAQEFGFQVQPIVWNEGLKGCDHYIVRSTWDYVQNYSGFCNWLENEKQTGTNILNPISLILWNLNKKYLIELADTGIPVVPTQFVHFADVKKACLVEPAIDYWVLKPIVSASAWRTNRFRVGTSDLEEIANEYSPDEILMLQPLVDSIRSEGEYSLIYFNGVFSHTVVKRTNGQEFRVQAPGGKMDLFTATEEMLKVADQTIAHFSTAPLYARVDVVRWRGHFHLMELEIAEPSLYFKQAPFAAKTFWTALQARI